jgi:PKD repeat protein
MQHSCVPTFHPPFWYNQGEKMKRRIFTISFVLSALAIWSLMFGTMAAGAITATVTKTITSTAIPGSDFVGTPLAGFAPLTVQFTHLNAGILSSCTWTFGDGTTQSFSPPAGQTSFNLCPSTNHVYATPGVYTVRLSVMKVTGATGSTTKTNYITVTNPGEFTVTPSRTPIPCGAVIVVTSTFTPTITATPTRTATATATSCGPIYRTATPDGTSLPDLVISSITFAGSSPSCANQPKNSVVVTNNGTVAAGTFQVSYSAGGVPQPAQTVNGLAAGQSVTLLFSSASGAGMTVTATADSTNMVAESNESNNTNSAILPIPTQAPTCTPTGPTNTPTRTSTITPTGTGRTPTSGIPTRTWTPTPVTTGTCSPTSTITAPFVFDGAGIFCWQSSNLGSFINSWSTTSVTLNGTNITNMWIPSSSYPAKIGGFWYVGYNSSVTWGHFEAK